MGRTETSHGLPKEIVALSDERLPVKLSPVNRIANSAKRCRLGGHSYTNAQLPNRRSTCPDPSSEVRPVTLTILAVLIYYCQYLRP